MPSRALMFVALPYHTRILFPVAEEMARRGCETQYFTVPAEACFEATMNQFNIPYKHVLDFMTSEMAETINKHFLDLRQLWQDRLLLSRVLQAVPVPIQDKVIRSILEVFFCMGRMIDEEKPDIIFALHELNAWGKMLGWHASHCAIPYLTFQEGLCYAPVPLYRYHTDYSSYCVVWGEADRETLLAAGAAPEKVLPLGNIDLWSTKKKVASPREVTRIRQALELPDGRKIVLFLMAHAPYAPFQPAGFLDWLAKRGDLTAIFKWHPTTPKDVPQRALQDIKGLYILSLHDYNTYDLLGVADVCVLVGNSTTGIEALVFDRPMIEVALPDSNYSYAKYGVVDTALGFEDLPGKIENLLQNGIPHERQQKVKEYLAHHFAYQDENTATRVADLAISLIEKKNSMV